MAVLKPVQDNPVPRWRVVLVRLPAGGSQALQAVLPRERPVHPNDLPLVLRVSPDIDAARRTARRLRAAGAVVAVLEESALPEDSPYCPDHPTGLAPQTCRRCGRPICAVCRLESRGAHLCSRCRSDHHRQRQGTRTRQLFVLFLFTVFLFEVYRFLRADREAVRGDGPVRVGIYQFAPPGSLHAPIVRALNGQAGLRSLGPWFDRERSRYTGLSGRYLSLSVRGPWPEQIQPPAMAGPEDGLLRTAYRSWRYLAYFRSLSSKHGIERSDFGVHVYVIYGAGAGDLAAHSRGSSTARTAIAWVDLAEASPAYALVTVGHELAHALGAEDLYDPTTGYASFPRGYVEPFAEPPYPQRYAELMAVDVPLAPDAEREVRALDEVRIGAHTAAHLGWIAHEQAAWYYDPESREPAFALPPRDAVPTAAQQEPAPVPQATADPPSLPDTGAGSPVGDAGGILPGQEP